MSATLEVLANLTGGRIIGNPQVIIDQVKPIDEAKEGDITFISNPKYLRYLDSTKASAVIVSGEVKANNVSLLQVKNPYAAFARILTYLNPPLRPSAGVHFSASVAYDAQIGEGVYIGPNAVIGSGAVIGDNCYIYPGVYIGNQSRLGENCVIFANVSIYDKVAIGNNVILHSGTVIGSDGFGYVFAEGKQQKIPQVGTVVIEDDVEIGANVAVDRGTLGVTRIGKGTKIDNLVQVAHNVSIGEHSIIVGQAGISGSVKLGKRNVLGGQSGLVGHIQIADDVQIAARATVTKSVTKAGATMAGMPAIDHQKWLKEEAALRLLPQLYEKFHKLEKQVRELSEKAK